jgi:hypothetical protein
MVHITLRMQKIYIVGNEQYAILYTEFVCKITTYCEDWKMMFTQRSLEHELYYSLKVLAHFSSK